FMIWATQSPATQQVASQSVSTYLPPAGTSIWVLLLMLQAGLLLLPGLLLPFINADGVTRDWQRRTHELLMTTSVPSRTYVWGRYLTSLLISLGLAVLMLAGILIMDLLRHLAISTDPLPPIGKVLILWVGMIVPATILLSSASFALGTLLPRQSMLVKIVILLAWFIGVVFLPPFLARSGAPPAWYSSWDPTSAATASALLVPYDSNFISQFQTATSAEQAQHILLTVENTLYSVGPWFVPHLIEALLSLLLVVLAAYTFQRFRNAFNG
ncbi:MAG TPA: ABC transporter permease, partial [Ktedonobacterales bacterium]|nr:ABC transporter permease [Ktedonobacterales bacterium]